jgi:fructose-bisphosphate aldolase class II
MPLVNTKDILIKAFENHYAIGAFNISNMETIQAIVNAAELTNSSVILQVTKSSLDYAGASYLKSLVYNAANNTDIKIALHLDHGPDLETVKYVIDNGFTSVMYDGSKHDYKTNVKITKQVVEYAHEKNITVEAELGKLAGIEDNVNVSKHESSFTDPDQAVDFVIQTGIDSLAVAIGTSHGAYKFKGEAKLDFERLNTITKKLDEAGFKKFPIVLHGASSVEKKYVDLCNQYGAKLSNARGVPDNMLKEASALSVCKINVDTDIRIATTAAIRKFFILNPDKIDPRDYFNEARKVITEIVEHKMRDIFGSASSN